MYSPDTRRLVAIIALLETPSNEVSWIEHLLNECKRNRSARVQLPLSSPDESSYLDVLCSLYDQKSAGHRGS